jgi:serine protease Do
MFKSPALRILLLLTALALVLSGCGGQETLPTPTPAVLVVTATPGPTQAATAEPTKAATEAAQATTPEAAETKAVGSKGGSIGGTTETATPPDGGDATLVSGAVNTLQGVRSAVIQIEAQGSFVDPEFGFQANTAGRGSGFFVNSTGLAITNNHVATGAAFLKVWVAGETDPRNAKILGVSECSDLAVIQVEGDSPAFLEWFDGRIEAGLEVYVAGFPLGDPEYTLTRGIVSKEKADGDTGWASIDYVIEHDAAQHPGNSGGPLVSKDGTVVGVHFAYNDQGQGFAIGRDEVERVFPSLAEDKDVNSIGVNGQIVGDGTYSGIWVASVASGSPADKAGIKGGDLIMDLEGLTMGMDGTMADYCSVLKSHNAGDTLSLRVLRYATGEVLEGQLNGRELEVTETVDVGGGTSGGGGDTSGSTMTVQDDTGALEMDVPSNWDDVASDIWIADDGTEIGPRLIAAPSVDRFLNSYDADGVVYIGSVSLLADYDAASFLNEFDTEIRDNDACATIYDRETYSDPFYEGVIDRYDGCGTSNGSIVIVAALPEDGSYMLVVWVQYHGTAGEAAVQTVLDSFWVPGTIE